jgi:hypothetical protein
MNTKVAEKYSPDSQQDSMDDFEIDADMIDDWEGDN